MSDWVNSIYSDGTRGFVSSPSPKIGDEVTVSVRFFKDAPVKHVQLWYIANGAEYYTKMEKTRTMADLVYYSCKLKINEQRVQYHFVISTEDCNYFYTQAGVTTVVPDYRHDFVLLTDYVQPDWFSLCIIDAILSTSSNNPVIFDEAVKLPILI